MTAPLTDLPPAERPRARLKRLGAQALTTAEVLELLFDARPRDAASEIGQRLLEAAGGSVRRLSIESESVLRRVRGIGPRQLAQLHAAFELARRWATENPLDRPRITRPSDIAALYAPRLRDLPYEEFHVGALDTQLGLVRDICVSHGSLSRSLVHTREVFLFAVEARAAALALIHNHPSGDPTPSPEDRVMTQRLATAGRLLDIPIHDHVIIGSNRYVSFQEEGWI